jgi:hypothetical protein
MEKPLCLFFSVFLAANEAWGSEVTGKTESLP